MDLSKSYEVFQPEKHKTKIHIVGCGSVGSTVAENLVRFGLTNLVLWDFDVVEPHNLANQIFRQQDLHKPKVEALLEILTEINPEVKEQTKLKPKGYQGEMLSGYVFLCVDSIELRREIATTHKGSDFVKAMFDFRTGLYDAQHYAADWSDRAMVQDFLKSMQFSSEDAKLSTPVSACNVELCVCPTVRIISALGVANFMHFWNDKPLKKVILMDSEEFELMAF